MPACRSCHAEIDWAGLEGGGPIPIDRASAGDPKGNLAIRRIEHGTLRARYLRKGEQPQAGEVRGISHFATCPDAPAWRKRLEATDA